MASQICIDVNIVLKLVLAEQHSDLARKLWLLWLEEEAELIAPPLFMFEGVSAIRANVTRKLLTEDTADTAFEGFLVQSRKVLLVAPPNLHEHAWRLARQLAQTQVYDSYYLALAEIRGCEFWTADEKLYRAAHHLFPWVKHIASFYNDPAI